MKKNRIPIIFVKDVCVLFAVFASGLVSKISRSVNMTPKKFLLSFGTFIGSLFSGDFLQL
jgi:hypothetical protein